jgi:hypothetical protein
MNVVSLDMNVVSLVMNVVMTTFTNRVIINMRYHCIIHSVDWLCQ